MREYAKSDRLAIGMDKHEVNRNLHGKTRGLCSAFLHVAPALGAGKSGESYLRLRTRLEKKGESSPIVSSYLNLD